MLLVSQNPAALATHCSSRPLCLRTEVRGKQSWLLWSSLAADAGNTAEYVRFASGGMWHWKDLNDSGESHRVLFFGETTPTVTAVIEVIHNERNLFSQSGASHI